MGSQSSRRRAADPSPRGSRQRFGICTRRRTDVAALRVDQHEEPCGSRVVADLLESAEPVGAERLEECRLRFHGDDVRPDRVDDPLAEARDRRRRGRTAEHGLAAELHRQEVEPSGRVRRPAALRLRATASARRSREVARPPSPTGYAARVAGRVSDTIAQLGRRTSQNAGDDEERRRVLRGERQLPRSRPPRAPPRARSSRRRHVERFAQSRILVRRRTRARTQARVQGRARRAPARGGGRARRLAPQPRRARRCDHVGALHPRSAGRARAEGAWRGVPGCRREVVTLEVAERARRELRAALARDRTEASRRRDDGPPIGPTLEIRLWAGRRRTARSRAPGSPRSGPGRPTRSRRACRAAVHFLPCAVASVGLRRALLDRDLVAAEVGERC